MHTFLISGDSFVAEHFIRQILSATEHAIVYLETRGRSRDDLIARLTATDPTAAVDQSRLTLSSGSIDKPLLGIDPGCFKSLNVSQFWHFSAPVDWLEDLDETFIDQEYARLQQLLALCQTQVQNQTSVTFNYVGTAYANGTASGVIEEQPFESAYPAAHKAEIMARAAETQLLAAHDKSGLNYRIFRPSMILAPASTPGCPTFLHALVKAITRIKHQAQNKVPGYFSRFGLTLDWPQNSTINMVPLEQVIAQLMAGADSDNNRIYHLVHPQDIAVSDVLGILAQVCDVPIQLGCDDQTMMPQDKLLSHISEFFKSYFSTRQRFCTTDSFQAASQPLSMDLLQATMLDIHQHQSALLTDTQQPTGAPLLNKQLQTANGKLDYVSCGEGPKSLFIVNAFGLNLSFWSTLIDLLSKQYKVVFWQHRNRQSEDQLNNVYYDDDDYLASFIDDAKALLDAEQIDSCHLLGWCSGPKLAMELADKLPERVASLMMLTPSFPGVTGFDNQDSAFEKKPADHVFDDQQNAPGGQIHGAFHGCHAGQAGRRSGPL